MTGDKIPLDDSAILHRVMADADALLLDFDGPVCSVFAGFPAPVVAEQLREILAEGGHNEIPPEVQKSEDPFDVLKFAASIGEIEANYTELALRAHEVEAIESAEPTPGAHDLIRAWKTSGRTLAIVSNNSAAAVETYLHLHNLTPYVDYISARTESNPSLLKPNPFLLYNVFDALELTATKCILIGDSLTDIQAAQAVKTPVIGYANKPGKVELFVHEGPSVITTSIESISQSLATLDN